MWHLALKLLFAMALGTITLLGLADNPWDGDELFKGPLSGLLAYGGGNLDIIYEKLGKL